MYRINIKLILLFIVFVTNSAFSQTYTAKVVGVTDGDTIKILKDKQQIKIRLYGVDTPEKKQDFGSKAKQFTSYLLFGKIVTVKEFDKDRYGRTIALIYINGKCLNEELVRNGFAWVYTQYCKESFCLKWPEYQEQAKQSKRGLWSQKNPVPPWEFRRNWKLSGVNYAASLKIISS